MIPYHEEDCITRDYAKTLKPGDKLLFVDFRAPERRDKNGKALHNKVCTVKHVSPGYGGVEIEERPGAHYILECFHRIISMEVNEDDFDAVFG